MEDHHALTAKTEQQGENMMTEIVCDELANRLQTLDFTKEESNKVHSLMLRPNKYVAAQVLPQPPGFSPEVCSTVLGKGKN